MRAGKRSATAARVLFEESPGRLREHVQQRPPARCAVHADDKSVSVEFVHPDLRSTRPSSTEASMQGGTSEILRSVRIYLEFKLEKMQFGGAPAF